MNDLRKAIEVGAYPARCFHGSTSDHRRFLRQLVNHGHVHFRDAEGAPHDPEAIRSGGIRFNNWYVTKHDAETIAQKIEEEAVILEEQERRVAERKRIEAEQLAEDKKRRKEQIAELKAAGLWDHPKYKTLRAARADGWHMRREDELGGDEITIKGYTLVRNTTKLHYVYETTLRMTYGMTPSMIQELGEPDKVVTNPHFQSAAPGCLYLVDRVEAWVDENQERIKKARESRSRRSAAMKGVHRKKRAERRRLEQQQMRLEEERFSKEQEWLQTLPITIVKPLPTTLMSDAMRYRNQYGHSPTNPERAILNHVRHRYTNYHTLLKEIETKEFPYRLHPLLRQRVNAVVMEVLTEWKATVGDTSCNGSVQIVTQCGKEMQP